MRGRVSDPFQPLVADGLGDLLDARGQGGDLPLSAAMTLRTAAMESRGCRT